MNDAIVEIRALLNSYQEISRIEFRSTGLIKIVFSHDDAKEFEIQPSESYVIFEYLENRFHRN